MTTRVLAPLGGAKTTIGGVTYQAAEGASLDVSDDIAFQLVATGWTFGMPVGTTAQRPTNTIPVIGNSVVLKRGLLYLDTTLAIVVVFDGKVWRNPATLAAV